MIYLDGIVVTPTVFPDGTSQVWHIDNKILESIERKNECHILWEFQSDWEFICIAQLKTLLDQYTDHVNLSMPFLPYGRQDKAVSNTKSFGLRTFANLINNLNFNSVETIDSHNPSRSCYIKGLEDKSARPFILEALKKTMANLVLFPDKGAEQRYSASIFINKPQNVEGYISANKKRDPSTGKILSIDLNGDPKGFKVLIVDDICDGGMTFKLVAQEAYAKKAKEVHLYVTHGIFSQGIQTIYDSGIKRIFTRKGEVVNSFNS